MNSKTTLDKDQLEDIYSGIDAAQKELLIAIHTKGITPHFKDKVHLCKEDRKTLGFKILGYEYVFQVLIDNNLRFTLLYSGTMRMSDKEAVKLTELVDSIQNVINSYLVSYGNDTNITNVNFLFKP